LLEIINPTSPSPTFLAAFADPLEFGFDLATDLFNLAQRVFLFDIAYSCPSWLG
jgi:hypothetical protein